VPAGTFVAVSVTAADPVSDCATLDAPEVVPASKKYEVGASPDAGARHVNVTVDPLTLPMRALGGCGTARTVILVVTGQEARIDGGHASAHGADGNTVDLAQLAVTHAQGRETG
jgi:hypothetical protein